MQYGDEKGKIFVGGLSWDTTHATMLKYFSRYGEVIDCVVMKNPQTGKSRGFGFVTFKDPSCVKTVLANQPHVLDSRQIDPKQCNPRSMNKGGKSAENSKRKVFMGGLPSNITEDEIKEHFAEFGEVQDVVIMVDQDKERSRGFGFLTFDCEESVEKVISQHYVPVKGKQVECKRAQPREMKLMADCAALPSGFSAGGACSMGLIPGTPYAFPASSLPGAMAAGYPGAFTQAYPSQGLRLVSPSSPLVTLLGTMPGSGNAVSFPGSYQAAAAAAAAAATPTMDLGGSSALLTPSSSTSTPSPYAPQVPTPTFTNFRFGAGSQAGGSAQPLLSPGAPDAGSDSSPKGYPLLSPLGFVEYTPPPSVSPHMTSDGTQAYPGAPPSAMPPGGGPAHISFTPTVTYTYPQPPPPFMGPPSPHMPPPSPQGAYGGGLAGSNAAYMTAAMGGEDCIHTKYY
ncbi:hypothetical protein CAPTEDRAFT_219071 [Capitella teleta]|uniref:RRM domain-containing protein n=1 Tax=Capitella teleta TaxID=283909 RepID=R7VCB8_CAPTE|nr:hypothetical protein CAPTEDRAFT_219071 [Capitella teleta]|eukprot:ELU13330.1 hypothetical protein CAPTEDRAFT_219071 [Capitella teleta]